MKFYNSEGRCIRNTADSDFGWNLGALNLSDSDEFEVTYPSVGATTAAEDKIAVYDPKIPVFVAKNSVECIVDETPNTTTKMESGLFARETLADLIQGDSLEAKTLLSVINPQKASSEQANFTSPTKDLNDLRNVSHQVKISDDLYGRQSIGTDLHNQGCFKNTLSLMDELTLAEHDTKYFMFGQSMEQDSGIDCGDGFMILNDELQDSVMECDYQTLRLQQEVRVLRKEYKVCTAV